MFERFTEGARNVVTAAQAEARAVKHNWIGTEHLLLGLLAEKEGMAAKVLVERFGLTLVGAREDVLLIVGPGAEAVDGQIPITPRAQKVLELALREALSLGNNYIGTQHILLGLVRENEGVGARVLHDRDVDSEDVRNAVIREMTDSASHRPTPPTSHHQMEFARYTVDIEVRCRRAPPVVHNPAAPELSRVAEAAAAAARRVIEDAGFEVTDVGRDSHRTDMG